MHTQSPAETTPYRSSEYNKGIDAQKATEIINDSIRLAHEIPEGAAGEKLEKLANCALRLGLISILKKQELEDFYRKVPAAKDYAEELKASAHAILEDPEISITSTQVAHDIGLAADLSYDNSLLEGMIEELKDTTDLSLQMHHRACQEALKEEEPYFVALQKVKAGKTTIAITNRIETYDKSSYLGNYREKKKPIVVRSANERAPLFSDDSVSPIPEHTEDMPITEGDLRELQNLLRKDSA